MSTLHLALIALICFAALACLCAGWAGLDTLARWFDPRE